MVELRLHLQQEHLIVFRRELSILRKGLPVHRLHDHVVEVVIWSIRLDILIENGYFLIIVPAGGNKDCVLLYDECRCLVRQPVYSMD